MKFYVKIHKDKMHEVVAIADEDVIGKTFEEGELCITISERFYKGELKDEMEVKKIFMEEDNINIAGNKVVDLAIKSGIISEKNVIKIQGVKHAQIVR
ncbi:DUF424 family protein [Candidatus Woesearchaeota archaeon]|nr:DUF424 family protein [Candidatus Woesearchaeota archaeon]